MTGIDRTAQSIGPEYQDIVNFLKSLMIEHSLPLWSGEGWDPVAGGFIEKLDIEGRADRAAPRRVRVQARQIYSFAKAAQMGWYPEGREIAIKGLDYLLAKAKSPDGRPGFVHLLGRDGSTLNATRDTYDHAFVLLALSTVYRLSHDAQVRDESSLFVANLYDPQRGVLGEYFEEDWSKIEPVSVEPGHQAEWVWLLKGFERITGCPTARHRGQLLASALHYRDPATGLLVDEGDADGNIRKSTRRCWPQTEIAKAWIAQAEAGEAGAADDARTALARLERHYLSHPVAGGWYDQFDRDGNSLVATIPASSFYHVLCAVAEAEQVLG